MKWCIKTLIAVILQKVQNPIIIYYYIRALCWYNTDFFYLFIFVNKISHKNSNVGPEAAPLTEQAWLCCPAVDISAYINLSCLVLLVLYFWEKAREYLSHFILFKNGV